MTELVPRRPLDARDSVVGDVRLIVRNDLTAHLLTTCEAGPIEGTVRLGPCEHLFVGTGGDDGLAQRAGFAGVGAALIQDMTSAFVFIDVIGPDLSAKLGIPRFDSGTGGATRLADLPVFVECRDSGLRIILGRSRSAYAWSWLMTKLATGHGLGKESAA